MTEFSIEAFEDLGRENGTRYWLAHDFMRSLGYESWVSFRQVITRSMASCANLGLDPTEPFQATTFIQDGQQVSSYKLSRFACLLVAMNADSRKPETARAKAALAAIADQLIQQHIADHDMGRIETRQDLKTAEKIMSGVAQDAGLQSTRFGLFKDAGFRGMYNMGLRELQTHKGLDSKKVLYDFMGLEELAGNLFRVTQTAARIKHQSVRGERSLINTASEVGAEVRGLMIKSSGAKPEALPLAEDVADLKKRLKTANRAMKKLDGTKKRPARKISTDPLPE